MPVPEERKTETIRRAMEWPIGLSTCKLRKLELQRLLADRRIKKFPEVYRGSCQEDALIFVKYYHRTRTSAYIAALNFGLIPDKAEQ